MRAWLALALVITSAPTFSAPFPTVDQNSLLNGFTFAPTITARLPVRGTSNLMGTLNWSNTAAIQTANGESLILDAESREWLTSFEYALADAWQVRIRVPYRTSNGGTLDSAIESWHSLFGMPNGDRPALPENAFRIDYQRNGQSAATYLDDVSGVGDISATVAYQLRATNHSATSLALTVKAPTGSSKALTGSGAADAVLTLAHEHSLSSRWLAYAQVNGAYLGVGELLPMQQRQSMWSGMLALDYLYSPALSLTLQLDGHTAAFDDSQLDLLGSAWILTFGGEYRWRSHWRAQVGVSEDVKVAASPDVNFVLSIGKEWQ
jgi:hypothetical protein